MILSDRECGSQWTFPLKTTNLVDRAAASTEYKLSQENTSPMQIFDSIILREPEENSLAKWMRGHLYNRPLPSLHFHICSFPYSSTCYLSTTVTTLFRLELSVLQFPSYKTLSPKYKYNSASIEYHMAKTEQSSIRKTKDHFTDGRGKNSSSPWLVCHISMFMSS